MQATNFGRRQCTMSAICSTCVSHQRFKGGTSPYEKRHRKKPYLQHARPFGTVGYARRGKRAHELAPKGETIIMLGLAHNYPRDTVMMLIVGSGEVVHSQISLGSIACQPRTSIPTGDMKEAMPVGVGGGSIEAYKC